MPAAPSDGLPRFAGCVTGVLFCCVWWSAAAHAQSLTFYVSTTGNDSWSGRLAEADAGRTDGPVATLHRARDLARASREADGKGAPTTVLVREGTYYLETPLVFGPDDSGTEAAPLIFRAFGGERVILSGGRPIAGPWQSSDGVTYRTTVPGVEEGTWWFRQLRVGDERQSRCRHPNSSTTGSAESAWLYVGSPRTHAELGVDYSMGLGQLQEKGTRLEYDIDVPADGRYLLRVLYANSGATNKRFFDFTDMSKRTAVLVDGKELARVDDLTDTGSFYKGFRWARGATLELTRGRHTVAWVNTEGGALTLVAFLLSVNAEYEPSVPGQTEGVMPRPEHTVAWDAEAFARKQGELVGTIALVDRKDPSLRVGFTFRNGDLKAWKHLGDAEVFVIPEYDWVSEVLQLESVDETSRRAVVAGENAMKPLFAHNRYCVMNVLDILDTAGEWCLVRGEGALYYRPVQADFQKLPVVAPYLDRVIELRGDTQGGRPVEHIAIEGFTITDTRYTAPERVRDVYFANDAAVWLVAARHCRIAGNTFSDVGGYAVRVRDASRDNAIVRNEVRGAGQGGVYLDGYEEDADRKPMPDGRRPSHNLVAGNHIHHCGLFYVHVSGVYVSSCPGNRIAYNTISHMPRYGVSLKDNCPGTTIELNDIRFTNLLTRDSGAIEMAGNYGGSTVRHNFVADTIGSGFMSRQARHASPADAAGIYLDNMSSQTTVVGNVVVRSHRGVWINWGGSNLVEGNVFTGNRSAQIFINLWRQGMGARNHGVNRLTRNVIVSSQPATPVLDFGGWRAKTADVYSDHNCVWSGGASPVVAGIGGAPEASWKAWQQTGQEEGTLVADPRLMDPVEDGFPATPSDPAGQLKLTPLDMSRVGVKGYQASVEDGI